MRKPTLTVVRSGEELAAAAAEKRRVAFSTMKKIYRDFWKSPEPQREQVAMAQTLADWEKSHKEMRRAGQTRAASEERRRIGIESAERVRIAAAEVMKAHPHLTRDEVAHAICKGVELSFDRTVTHLKRLRLFGANKK